jgi:hypothetical protein
MYENIILIPYRNRKEHFDIFLKEAIPIFIKYLKKCKIVIIEQNEGKDFNRGMLLNIGFKEYINQSKFFFHHDIDIIPKEPTVEFIYNINNFDILRIINSHGKSLGGIIKFTNDSFIRMNGFPNYIWGWGIEDRILFYRSNIVCLNVSDNLTNKSYFKFLHHSNSAVKYTGKKEEINNLENYIYECGTFLEKNVHIKKSGLSNLKYKIISRKNINNHIEIIKVDI